MVFWGVPNIFRLVGDMSHALAIIILFMKMWKSRSVAGISGKSQILFAIVCTSRYLDLFTAFVPIYNTALKIFFIGTSYVTVYLIYQHFKRTYDSTHDTFRVEFLIVPVCGMAVLVNHEFTTLEIMWTFSIYLESVAILPQLFMVIKIGETESIVSFYLFVLGSYRALYILNWIYRYYFEGFYDMIAVVAGCVQTILFGAGGFFIHFHLHRIRGLYANACPLADDLHRHCIDRKMPQTNHLPKEEECISNCYPVSAPNDSVSDASDDQTVLM
ncbi:ER lumen protein-retaining receptor 2-like [Dreissena polymorpha]|uniref:ER lumen protein-retaining receptor n=1 Tax=Dreissena polymorpha TaxID=45954 RepID=A0A9D4M796_DREPO|nr:ER lumen protein-retaining receptor 2-like [Dreissena polymorpha]KAH3872075.1 hypothetical protein DPMN_035288 [Dreissena polymorpha]